MSWILRRHKNLLVVYILISIVLFFVASLALAHGPHDNIDALEISPNYAQDKTLFVVVAGESLQKSEDGGFSWKHLVNGLDNKSRLSFLVISPDLQFDQTLFVSTEEDGIYRSKDGGASWYRVNNGLKNLNITILAVSSNYQTDNILLAANHQGVLYKTKDGGDHWYSVIKDGIPITAIAFSPDPQKRFVAIGDQQGRLYFSTDGGEIWQRRFEFSHRSAITSIAISPRISSDGVLFAGTAERGIFKSVDAGVSFRDNSASLSRYLTAIIGTYTFPKHIISIAISPTYETDSTIFASTWNEAVFQSNDGGNTWKIYKKGLTTDEQADSKQYKSPHFRDVRISKKFGEDQTIFLSGFDGLFKSTDGGRVWTQMETVMPRLITGLAVSPAVKEESVIAITAAGGVYITKKPGLTWTVNNNGLNRIGLLDIVFSPNYHMDHTIFSASETDFVISTDRGEYWNKVDVLDNSQINRYLRSGVRKLGLSVPNLLKPLDLKPDMIVVSPNYESDHTLYLGTRYEGVYRSVDGTRSWFNIWGKKQISDLVISSDFASDRTLFASERHTGVYKTADRGDTWQAVNNGLAFLSTNAWQSASASRLARTDIDLAISPDYRNDQTVFAGAADGLFQTIDGGENWNRVQSLGNSGNDIEAISLSPNYKNDATLLISIRGRGLFKSIDKGKTFIAVAQELIDNNYSFKQIEFSPSYFSDQTIYGAATEEIFQSIDGGHHWRMLPRPVRYENRLKLIQYEGNWKIASGHNFSATSVNYSNAAASKAVLNFVGRGITWLGTASTDQGIARVSIDGVHQADVDQFHETPQAMVNSFSAANLSYGPHTITIEVTEAKNPESTGSRITIDAFDILP